MVWMSLFSDVVWAMGQAPSGAAGGGGNPLAPFLPLIIIFAIGGIFINRLKWAH